MRRTAQILAVLSVLCVLALTGRAGEGDAAAIIKNAIKAHFPKGIDPKKEGVRTKAKGTLHVQGLKLDFTQEVSVHAPKFKEVMELDVMGKKIVVVSVFDGKNAWIRADDKDVKVTDEILAAFKDAAYGMALMQGAFGSDKSVKFSLLGEVQVKGKAALGVTVSKEGKKDINLFFDKKTSLITKVEMRTRDLMSGQEVTEERYITEYQDVDGRKVAKKIEVMRDGKELLTAEVTDTQILDKVDAAEFTQPK
jgi:hypothetical protein